jgi:hypothetical protein
MKRRAFISALAAGSLRPSRGRLFSKLRMVVENGIRPAAAGMAGRFYFLKPSST